MIHFGLLTTESEVGLFSKVQFLSKPIFFDRADDNLSYKLGIDCDETCWGKTGKVQITSPAKIRNGHIADILNIKNIMTFVKYLKDCLYY